MTFIAVRTQLKAIIDSIAVSAGIGDVFDFMPNTLENTPTVAIIADRSSEEMNDTGRNELTINYLIRVMVEETEDLSAQIAKILTVTDAILDELRLETNETLSGTVHYFLAEEISPIQYGEVENMNAIYQDIRIASKALKSI